MRARLGDDIDDFCVKCKRVMNHLIVSLLNGEPAKVRCRTCHGDHDFRHEQAPPPKIDARKAALMQQQALEKAAAAGAGADGTEPNIPPDVGITPEAAPVFASAVLTVPDSSANVLASPLPLAATKPARKNARAK
jgi:hypothetical protein